MGNWEWAWVWSFVVSGAGKSGAERAHCTMILLWADKLLFYLSESRQIEVVRKWTQGTA